MKSDLFILIVCLLFPAYACADTSKHALEENRKLLHSLDSLLEQAGSICQSKRGAHQAIENAV